MPDLAADLEAQRDAIINQVAKSDAGEALELMWRFIDLAEPVHERFDNSNWVIGDVFRGAWMFSRQLAESPVTKTLFWLAVASTVPARARRTK